ncbi:hypothetical protein [Emticicia sp. BO119]|uniref:hypothetical protein n=1 Tax=Emticicia sp. BO119 TaxID=2757768 RepID=UPI0015F00966|nr:hypothetical protein [Emticicia sp. BO119]MBA4848866.1 hypothetical protein [Emticicia sp. BO119]
MDFIPADKPLEKEILPLFTKTIPFQLPVEWKEFIVKVTPWVMVLLVPLHIFVIGLSAFASLFTAFFDHPLWSVGMLVSAAGLICSLLSIKGLFDRKREGWVWAYYAFLLFLLSDILYLRFIDAIITFLISGYFLFQIREYYK